MQRLTRRYTESAKAYEHYIRGRYHWNRRSAQSLERAIEDFQKAINEDPSYALAYAGLADSYILLPYFALVPPMEGARKAKEAAERALSIDDSLAEAHTSLAFFLHRADRDWAGAGREFRRALQLNPGYATAHHWYANYLAGLGRFDEALEETRRAHEADPLSLPISGAWARILHMARRYDEALEIYRKSIEMEPDFAPAHTWKGAAWLAKGDHRQAVAELESALKVSRQDPFTAGLLANALARGGRRDEAVRVVDGLRERAKREYVTPYGVALAYVGLGDKDQAFAWLDRACQEYSAWLFFAKVEPLLDPLRPDPRFEQALRKLGLTP